MEAVDTEAADTAAAAVDGSSAEVAADLAAVDTAAVAADGSSVVEAADSAAAAVDGNSAEAADTVAADTAAAAAAAEVRYVAVYFIVFYCRRFYYYDRTNCEYRGVRFGVNESSLTPERELPRGLSRVNQLFSLEIYRRVIAISFFIITAQLRKH